MTDLRTLVFATLTTILLFGTAYSVIYGTYLDTSNPLLTHLPHPLHKTNYFASKKNFLNVYFIKYAWGWTTAAFTFLFATSPPQTQARSRLLKWGAETLVWVVFTSWFFGPAVLERIIAASGGECVLALPSGDVLAVPQQYCFTKSTVSPATHPQLFATPLALPDAGWHSTPRLRRGHDVSGHIFLLTMSALFLADQLRSSFRARLWSPWHSVAVAANVALIGVWFFASYTTSVYFHSPLEKFTGYLLGAASFAITQLPLFQYKYTPAVSSDTRLHAN